MALHKQGAEVFRGPPTACSKLNRDDYTQNPYVCVADVDFYAYRPVNVTVILVSGPSVICL